MTLPAPVVNGVRPQARYTYTGVSAWVKTSLGSLGPFDPISMLYTTSSCKTQDNSQNPCAGTSDEVLTTINYMTGSSNTANNVLPISVKTAAGDNSVAATTQTTYDSIGNVQTTLGPRGATQKAQFFYDADREITGAVGPLNRAVKTIYTNGLATEVVQGTSTGYTDPNVSGFTPIAEQAVGYDAGLAMKNQVTTKRWDASSGWVTSGITQYNYDNAGRLNCVAVRMNRNVFGSTLPGACVLGTAGSDGPDRITSYSYTIADQLKTITTGFGTPDARNVQAITFNGDGLPLTLTDADGNRAGYVYDGLDRVTRIKYPSLTTQGASSATDYTNYTLDNAGNVLQLKQRNMLGNPGQVITFTYDFLNRARTKAPPGGPTVTYSYDNFGRLASATTGSQTVSYTYDALGRELTEIQPAGGIAKTYDPGFAWMRVIWPDQPPDTYYVQYDLDALNEVTAVKENGTAVLASYGYDGLGRRTSMSRGNGSSTTYTYADGFNLTSLTHSAGAASQGYTLGYNAAGQITSRAATNDAYTWPVGTLNQSYAVNLQNQYTTVGGTAYAYDVQANLASGPPQVYTFDSQNRLATASGSPPASFSYDPVDRLFQTAGSATTQFLYDGDQIVAEYGSGSLQRRYVRGVGEDEPIVVYDYSDSSDPKRYLLADERGSVIAGLNSSQTVKFQNTYDEYGRPGGSNLGRFQYTGQAWIPEAGAYSYKARVYLPSIGRFLQTDPSGYDAGMNLYAYAGSDPVNRFDPTGLNLQEVIVTAELPCYLHHPSMCDEEPPLQVICQVLDCYNSASQFDFHLPTIDPGKYAQFAGEGAQAPRPRRSGCNSTLIGMGNLYRTTSVAAGALGAGAEATGLGMMAVAAPGALVTGGTDEVPGAGVFAFGAITNIASGLSDLAGTGLQMAGGAGAHNFIVSSITFTASMFTGTLISRGALTLIERRTGQMAVDAAPLALAGTNHRCGAE